MEGKNVGEIKGRAEVKGREGKEGNSSPLSFNNIHLYST